MIEPRWILLGAAAPAALSAVALSGAIWNARGETSAWRPRLVVAAAVAAAWTLGHWATHGWPREPWNIGANWLLLIGWVSAALALLPRDGRVGRLGGAAVRLLLLAAIAFAMLQPAIQWVWTPLETAAWVAGLTLVAWIVTEGVVGVSHTHARHTAPAALAAAAAVAGVTGMMTGSVSVGQFPLVLAAILTGTAVVLWWRHDLAGPLAPALVGVAMPVLVACLLYGTHSSNLPMRVAALILVSPAMMWVTALPPLRKRPAWARVAAAAIAVAVPLGVALAFVVPRFIEDLNSPYSGY